MPEDRTTTDQGREVEDRIVGMALRFGAYTSMALILAGGLLALLHLAASHFLLQAGVLVLMATPILRVLVAMLVFAHGRDRRYTLISLGVLTILLLSILLAVLKIVPAL
jgi:uncharacterized membrane protein